MKKNDKKYVVFYYDMHSDFDRDRIRELNTEQATKVLYNFKPNSIFNTILDAKKRC